MREVSLAPQKNPERRGLRRDDGAGFRIVADAPATGKPGFGGWGLTHGDGRLGDRAKERGHVSLLIQIYLQHRLIPRLADSMDAPANTTRRRA